MSDKDEVEKVYPDWLQFPQTVYGNLWLPGVGSLPAKTLILAEKPSEDDMEKPSAFSGNSARQLASVATTAGFNMEGCYCTYVVKFLPTTKKPKASDAKQCAGMLAKELQVAQPKLIIALGAPAFTAIMGKKYAFAECRGQFIKHPELEGVTVFPTYNPDYIRYNPGAVDEIARDWKSLALWQQGVDPAKRPDDFSWHVLHKEADLKFVVDELLTNHLPPIYLAVDCEWHGRNWMDPKGYLRTVQFAYSKDAAIVIELRDTDGNLLVDNEGAIFKHLRELFQHPAVKLIGQNLISDGEWLMTYGVDVRANTEYDTMLAEHTLDSAGTFGLNALIEKYTMMARYDMELNKWLADNPTLAEDGYGKIPRELLLPYAAKDAIATYRIWLAQSPLIAQAGYLKPRGQYTSLYATVLDAQRTLYEVQRYGMRLDPVRQKMIASMYHEKLLELETQLVAMAAARGMPNYNFRSPKQTTKLLFQVLKLTPVQATGTFDNMPWAKVLTSKTPEEQMQITASTDKRTLDILQDADPLVKVLRDARKVDHAVKTWLPDDYDANVHNESEKGGGLLAKMWPDGRVHAHFSQLKETGRFSSSDPNMQNFPKKAEGDIKRIFGKDKKPPDIRTAFIPDPGYVFIEADFTQAELFVLAALSGDDTMMTALTTPGRDLHDLTAINSFGLQVLGPNGQPIADQYLLDLAGKDPHWDKDSSDFKKLQGQLIYVDQRGKQMSRKEFKDTIRVSAKNLNFGIPYGRGALDIAIQVKAETGTDKTIDELRNEIEDMMISWKTQTYPAAWNYMVECGEMVASQGFIENPWGRRRVFPQTHDRNLLAAMKREGQNFPIQSTVADTCCVAFQLLVAYRAQMNLHFRIVNQVHDAIILEVPEQEIAATKIACQETMGNIYIPVQSRPLRLGVEIDVMTRWGEKVKKE